MRVVLKPSLSRRKAADKLRRKARRQMSNRKLPGVSSTSSKSLFYTRLKLRRVSKAKRRLNFASPEINRRVQPFKTSPDNPFAVYFPVDSCDTSPVQLQSSPEQPCYSPPAFQYSPLQSSDDSVSSGAGGHSDSSMEVLSLSDASSNLEPSMLTLYMNLRQFAAPCSLSVGQWFRSLSEEAQKKFTSRRMYNLMCLMFELLDESTVPPVDLWRLYWAQTSFVQYLLGAHYVLTRVAPHLSVSDEVLKEAVQRVPFPLMSYFFRKNGLNVFLNMDRFNLVVEDFCGAFNHRVPIPDEMPYQETAEKNPDFFANFDTA